MVPQRELILIYPLNFRVSPDELSMELRLNQEPGLCGVQYYQYEP
jgi:hypothetical protein